MGLVLYRLGLLGRFGVAIVALLLILPVLMLLGMAITAILSAPGLLSHLIHTRLPAIAIQTVLLCIGVGLLTSTMGVLSAWWVSSYQFPFRRYVEWLLVLPLAMPSYVIAYAYTDALQYSGVVATALRDWFGPHVRLPDIRSLGGAVLVLSVVLYPYVYILARTAFLRRSPNLLDAARVLGCGPVGAFLKVALPVARPAWVVGVALVLMETLSEFGALSYFGVQTFTTAIFNTWLNLGDRNGAAMLSVVLLLAMGVLLLLEHRSRGRAQYFSQSARAGGRPKLLSGWRGVVVLVLCSMPFVLGFVLPVLILAGLVWYNLEPIVWHRVLQWVWHSAILGLLGAGLALFLAMLMAYGRRQSDSGWMQVAHRIMTLGYGIPGGILAIAVLVPLAALDRFTWVWGWPAITGSILALLYAYNVRFCSAALQSLDAGLQQITRHMDESAMVLGNAPHQVFWRVHVPILRSAMASGVLLVMVDIMKELPATLVLRPFNFDTLAVMAHQYAADERLAQAALPALCIVLVALVPVLLLVRQSAKSMYAY